MHSLLSPALHYNLALADGSRWALAAADAEAVEVVAQLGYAMQMHITPDAVAPMPQNLMRLLVRTDVQERDSSSLPMYTAFPSVDGGRCVVIHSPDSLDGMYLQLVRLALVFAREAQTRGGMLIHGALAERNGSGVILAAPGGRGKTTASNRLPPPWCSRCDDATLVVQDRQGNYWAHPWPTWSRFICHAAGGGTWDVQRAVPLKAIFFLSQACEDRAEPIGRGQAVSLLVECAEQAALLMGQGLAQAEKRALHLERFNNLCTLARVIPGFILHISLTGVFWDAIAQALEESDDIHKEQGIA